ncbi:MAG: cation diffusion facilitator family transporter [Solobacterium sp.]|nr:cation diffusion facilitator family transporter [Solobacterium sp.]
MGEKLLRKLIKNADDIRDETVRGRYGLLCSVTGICVNLMLFLVKLWIGIVMHAVSVISDAFNNLTDMLAACFSLIGFRISVRPADSEHPFGHGRLEYLFSLIVCGLVIWTGAQLLWVCAGRIIHPQPVIFSVLPFILLLVSAAVKVLLSGFYKKIGILIDSPLLRATADDARNDVFSTLIAAFGMVMSVLVPGIPFDAVAGLILSLFIIRSGIDLMKDVLAKIIGSPVNNGMIEQVRQILLSEEAISDVHDILLHDYGPSVIIGTAHAELDEALPFREVHEIIDRAEKEVSRQLHIDLTIHPDPVKKDDERSVTSRQDCMRILSELDSSLSLHDFSLDDDVLSFDVLVPFNCGVPNERIEEVLERYAQRKGLRTDIHLHHPYSGE